MSDNESLGGCVVPLPANLNAGQPGAMGDLVRLLQSKRDTLVWHHQVGTLLRGLSPGGVPQSGPRGWLTSLVPVLGWSPAPLNKMIRFSREFTMAEAVNLDRLGVTWSAVVFSAPARDRKERLRFLQESAQKGWAWEQVRAKAKKRFPSRHPKGGRPTKTPRNLGVMSGLTDLSRLTRQWLKYYKAVWKPNMGKIKRGGKEDAKRLTLVTEAQTALVELTPVVGSLLQALCKARLQHDAASEGG